MTTPEPPKDEQPVAWTLEEGLDWLEKSGLAYVDCASSETSAHNIPLYRHPAPAPGVVEELVARLGYCPITRDRSQTLWYVAKDAIAELRKLSGESK